MERPEPTADLETLLAHSSWVRRLAVRLVREHGGDAEDLVQDTWLAVLERRPENRKGVRSWLAKVLRHRWLHRRRTEERRFRREQATASPEALPSASEVAARAALQRDVVEQVLALPDAYRDVVLLRYFEELPPGDVARRLGIPVETVRTQLKRALPRIREGLERGWGRDPGALDSALVALAGSIPGPSAAVAAPAAASLLSGALAMKAKTLLGIAVAITLASTATVWMIRESPWVQDASPGPETDSSATVSSAVPGASDLGGAIPGPGPGTEGDATPPPGNATGATSTRHESIAAASDGWLLRVRTEDAEGRAVGNVALVLADRVEACLGAAGLRHEEARTDEVGEAELVRESPEGLRWLVAAKEEFVPELVSLAPVWQEAAAADEGESGATEARVVVRLEAPHPIVVRVVDELGTPVVEADVRAEVVWAADARSREPSCRLGPLLEPAARSDGFGEARLAVAPDLQYRLYVTREGSWTFADFLEPAALESDRREVTLLTGFVAAFRVEGIPETEVRAAFTVHEPRTRGPSWAPTRLLLPAHLRAHVSPYWLFAGPNEQDPGAPVEDEWRIFGCGDEVTVKATYRRADEFTPDDVLVVHLEDRLRDPATLYVQFLDDAGLPRAPVQEWQLLERREKMFAEPHTPRPVEGMEGLFVWERLPPGRYELAVGSLLAPSTTGPEVELAAGETRRLEFPEPLPLEPLLRLQVTDDRGRTVPKFHAWLRSRKGTHRVNGQSLPPGPGTLTVSAPGYADSTQDVVLESGSTLDLTVVLQPAQ